MGIKRRSALMSAVCLAALGSGGYLLVEDVKAASPVPSRPLSPTMRAALPSPAPPVNDPLLLDGVCENPAVPGEAIPVPPGCTARFLPNTSVLTAASATTGCAAPDQSAGTVWVPTAETTSSADSLLADDLPAVRASRAWLAAGLIPGRTTPYAQMATRALLDLRLALRPNGALLAGPTTIWAYVWPRDASWSSVAFSATGHHAEALRILRFLALVQRRDGTWAARTLPDGSGRVPDDRPDQLDSVGWVPWAAWYWYTTAPTSAARESAAHALWPTVTVAADVAMNSLQASGLPRASGDYWESGEEVTIGNAAALQCGLRAAADLAHRLGHKTQTTRWHSAAQRLSEGITSSFGATGYRRVPNSHAAVDAAVAWLGPPLAAPDPSVARAVSGAASVLRRPAGGVLPGLPGPVDATESWTPETAFFALCDAASRTGSVAGSVPGSEAESAAGWLDWLDAHRTPLGSLSERVGPTGRPASMAPLAWTNALVLLALRALEAPLPIPPSDRP